MDCQLSPGMPTPYVQDLEIVELPWDEFIIQSDGLCNEKSITLFCKAI